MQDPGHVIEYALTSPESVVRHLICSDVYCLRKPLAQMLCLMLFQIGAASLPQEENSVLMMPAESFDEIDADAIE